MSKIQLIKTDKPQGIHFHFENGMVASVQFGRGNSCHQLKEDIFDNILASASSVEIACYHKETGFDYLKDYEPTATNDYLGYVSIEEIPKFLEWCKNYKF